MSISNSYELVRYFINNQRKIILLYFYTLKNNKGYESISVSPLLVSGYCMLGNLSYHNHKFHNSC